MEENQNQNIPTELKTDQPTIPLKKSHHKLYILFFVLLLITIFVASGGIYLYNNYSSNCNVSWASFPVKVAANTQYTVSINKVSTTNKWRDVSVYKDLDINTNAPREGGLTGDDWQNPTNTYTFTFNSGGMGPHKLYFYNNDFLAYGEKSGAGPRTLCQPIFSYITTQEEKKLPDSSMDSNQVSTQSGEMVGLVVWNVKKNPLSPTELEIKNAYSTYQPPSSQFDSNSKLSIVSIELSTISANFAITGAALVDKNNQIIPTDGFQYYLYKVNNKWNIISGGDNNFCEVIKTFPSDLLTDSLKDYLVGCFPK